MPTALVTGATGLLGSYLVERLRRDGWTVRALVRDPDAARWLTREHDVALVAGDVLDAGTIAAAARGCDVLFHAAALITPRAGWEAFRRVNVEGTRAALAAAHAAGARLLHVSSVAVYGATARYGRGAGGTDERVPLAPLPPEEWYARSKRESEALVLDAHHRGELWATAIRPVVLYGRRDRQFVPRIARLLRAGLVPLPDGGRATLAVVHAANVAEAALLAATHDAAGGQAYNVANDFDVSTAGFLRLGARGLGRTVRIVAVPRGVARAGVGAASLALRLLGARPLATMVGNTVRFIAEGNPFTSERARQELGWRPHVRPEEGVPDAFRWWREHGEGGSRPERVRPHGA
ncbi:MAG TPA: NAD-dependent epimerase/dehydratase family protein [Gemmatimonadaceae bacterium]|nr:NAD-dependent epimerase/dehydratase family protein [Gemmatimonadaceae bacterium]